MFPNLYAEIARARMSTRDFAKWLGITEKSAKNKLDGVTEFKFSEIEKTRQLFPQVKQDYLFTRSKH